MKKVFAILSSIIFCFSIFVAFTACTDENNNPQNSQVENGQSNENHNSQNNQANNKPTGINLSKTDMKLETGSTYPLIATVIPATADQTVTWKSKDSTIASVSNDGTVTAIKDGITIITAVTSNNLSVSCTVEVSTPMGNVSGSITYLNGKNTVSDTGSIVYLISQTVQSLPDIMMYGTSVYNHPEEGIYSTSVDATGSYSINAPVGKYWIVVFSKNTAPEILAWTGSDADNPKGLGEAYWGKEIWPLLSDSQKNQAKLSSMLHKGRWSTIEISKNGNAVYSNDFGKDDYML